MAAAGRFLVYYTRMVYVPLTMRFVVAIQPLRDMAIARQPRRIASVLAVFACLAGLPARLTLTALQWSGRDYDVVRRFVAANVRPGDSLLSDWQAFYPLRSRDDIETFFPDYLTLLTTRERTQLTGLLLRDDPETPKLLASIGGMWRVAARMSNWGASVFGKSGLLLRFSARPYGNLVMYRRMAPDSAP
jgi:hypothetical protein